MLLKSIPCLEPVDDAELREDARSAAALSGVIAVLRAYQLQAELPGLLDLGHRDGDVVARIGVSGARHHAEKRPTKRATVGRCVKPSRAGDETTIISRAAARAARLPSRSEVVVRANCEVVDRGFTASGTHVGLYAEPLAGYAPVLVELVLDAQSVVQAAIVARIGRAFPDVEPAIAKLGVEIGSVDHIAELGVQAECLCAQVPPVDIGLAVVIVEGVYAEEPAGRCRLPVVADLVAERVGIAVAQPVDVDAAPADLAAVVPALKCRLTVTRLGVARRRNAE
jgi:hypothetical protein